MLATRWQPLHSVWSEMGRIQDEMNRALSRTAAGPRSLTASFPPMNIWEDEDHWYVEAELPGMELDDLEILVQDNQLTIQGERKQPELAEATWHRSERGFGKFSRSFQFSEDVDADKVQARLKQGVLLIELPKRAEVKPRRIEVKSE